MEIIDGRITSKIESVPNFIIETSEFIDLIQKIVNDHSFWTLTVGLTSDPINYRFDNIEDMKSNRSLIKVPFFLDLGDLKFVAYRNSANIIFEQEMEPKAKTILATLSKYRPWYRFLFRYWFPAVVMFAMYIVFTNDFGFDSSSENNSVKILKLGTAVLVLAVFLEQKLNFPIIYYRRRDTFWHRNLYAIIVGVIILIASVILTWFLTA